MSIMIGRFEMSTMSSGTNLGSGDMGGVSDCPFFLGLFLARPNKDFLFLFFFVDLIDDFEPNL